MKSKLMSKISVTLLISFITLSYSYAQENKDSHEDHHAETKVVAEKKNEMKMDNKEMNGMEMAGKDGMMSKEDMNKMNLMMKDCMKIHKDKKMCSKNVMEKCEMGTDKNSCQKMMMDKKM
ncbi:MAG: hypothetical protein H7336_03180 [Bacteriovorax sp.]|nr:hypothetical protein [Bacteriovorax sp.]